jgi:hypothetical protein
MRITAHILVLDTQAFLVTLRLTQKLLRRGELIMSNLMDATLILQTWKLVSSCATFPLIKFHCTIYSKGYPEFGKYLNETGRPMVYSCSWPAYWGDKLPNYPLIAKSCNLWRNYNDIDDSYTDMLNIIDHYGDHESDFAQYAGPGNWNDPDMAS